MTKKRRKWVWLLNGLSLAGGIGLIAIPGKKQISTTTSGANLLPANASGA